MYLDSRLITEFYNEFANRLHKVRLLDDKPLTLSEKIIYTHIQVPFLSRFTRGGDYVNFMPDRIAMQDATAQMALLQFMNSGMHETSVPTTVHCDHLIQANVDSKTDLAIAFKQNSEVFDFLESASKKFGIGFWQPGAGIIHQVILENYAIPGSMMIGTDSHTVNAGGLGMIAIGVGGADAVDVMAGMPWELKMPEIIGVKLTGKMSGWTTPKDVILKLAGILTVKGGTNSIIEYFGKGAKTISCTGKATICNMGAEVGATTSIFPYDSKMREYLKATGRDFVAEEADSIMEHLNPDPEVELSPENYYDRLIEIDLSTLEPYINGPFTPDAAYPVSEFVDIVKERGYPEKLEVGLIGSCTNSSYEDLTRSISIVDQALEKGAICQSEFIITPGSEQIRYTCERDGIIEKFERMGGTIMANACGPCIGQWKRHNSSDGPNSIITSFNRNFAKRNDGNPSTHAFVASPEIVTAMSIAGRLTFNPLTDTLKDRDGNDFKLSSPVGMELPPSGFEVKDMGYVPPPENAESVRVVINSDSSRLQALQAFDKWDGKNLIDLKLLIKVKGKCTTDHISMAGRWLMYRGHLNNISDNLLMGAVNFFNDSSDSVKNQLSGLYDKVSMVARSYKKASLGSIVIAEENYGEGSSREHAAMEPRHLGVRVVLVKSFARIHETNLKKQGVLALTFQIKEDYSLVQEDDIIDVIGLEDFKPGKPLIINLKHSDNSTDKIITNHTYNELQIDWFRAGSALNSLIENKQKK
jgi:aconitate hydratase